MSDAGPTPDSAGALLRAAREKRGLHIAALAASIKVPKDKLEALEADRYEALPDMTFTRALAQTVCRALKIDAEPVLARLPQSPVHRIEQLGSGLNAPFRERPGRSEPDEWMFVSRPAFWGTALVLLAAALLYLLPENLWVRFTESIASAPEPAASVPSTPDAAASVPTALPASAAEPTAAAPAVAASPVIETVHAAPAASAPESAVPNSAIVLRATGESWVEARESNGRVLLSRTLQAGETIGLDGALPLRVTIGNAPATELSFRGQRVDLAASTRDNVARIELK